MTTDELQAELGLSDSQLAAMRLKQVKAHGLDEADDRLNAQLTRMFREVEDHPRLLRALPPRPRVSSKGPPDKAAILIAAEESAYTRTLSVRQVPDAGEAVDPEAQRQITARAQVRAEQAAEASQAARQRHELGQRLMRVREDARLQGIDISSPERVIERQLVRLERRVYDGRA